MSNNYLYPKDTFKVNLELEVSLDFVGMWDAVVTLTARSRRNLLQL